MSEPRSQVDPAPRDGDGSASLGRFAPSAGESRMVEVQLLRLPLRVMRASREHNDGLMRELRILALSGQVGEQDLPARLVELVRILGERYGTNRDQGDADIQAAVTAGVETVDRVQVVPAAAAAEAAAQLGALVAEADAYCEQALLMSLPRPPVLRRFGDWYLGEFVSQVAGRPAVAWDGPLRVED